MPPSVPPNPSEQAVSDALKAHVRRVYGGIGRPHQVTLTWEPAADRYSLAHPVHLPAAAAGEDEFVPTPVQRAILKALAGRAMRGEALAAAMKTDKRRLYKAGGINELLDRCLVASHPRLGYYSAAEPPADLAAAAEAESA